MWADYSKKRCTPLKRCYSSYSLTVCYLNMNTVSMNEESLASNFLSTVGEIALLLLAASCTYFLITHFPCLRATHKNKRIVLIPMIPKHDLTKLFFPLFSLFFTCRKTSCTETSSWETWCWTNGKKKLIHSFILVKQLLASEGSVTLACQLVILSQLTCVRGPISLYPVCI